jgi:hypothetical protein
LQWNDADHPKGEFLTEDLAHEIHMEVLSSVNAVDSAIRKEISSLPQYKSLTSDMFLPPSFHLQSGMKNTAVAVFAIFLRKRRGAEI